MRSRNIKPSIFKNEILGTADPFLTIVFSGLWCAADRDGRLEDRPMRLRAEILPYRDNIDFNGYLTELCRLKFIERYTVDGINIIQVINFKKHQRPHHTEKASELPPPPSESDDISDGCCLTEDSPLKDGENPPDILIPDILIPEDSDTNVSLVNSPTVDDTCPHEKIIGLWHDRLPQCPKIRKWGESSKKNLRTRWRESKECQDLSWWSAFFEYISQSDFLTGKKNDFIATLGWVVKRTNFEKIINGNYENRGPCTGSSMTDSNIKTAVSWAERKKQQLKNEERNLIE